MDKGLSKETQGETLKNRDAQWMKMWQARKLVERKG